MLLVVKLVVVVVRHTSEFYFIYIILCSDSQHYLLGWTGILSVHSSDVAYVRELWGHPIFSLLGTISAVHYRRTCALQMARNDARELKSSCLTGLRSTSLARRVVERWNRKWQRPGISTIFLFRLTIRLWAHCTAIGLVGGQQPPHSTVIDLSYSTCVRRSCWRVKSSHTSYELDNDDIWASLVCE